VLSPTAANGVPHERHRDPLVAAEARALCCSDLEQVDRRRVERLKAEQGQREAHLVRVWHVFQSPQIPASIVVRLQAHLREQYVDLFNRPPSQTAIFKGLRRTNSDTRRVMSIGYSVVHFLSAIPNALKAEWCKTGTLTAEWYQVSD
jgi:hypothetical protein